MERLNRRLLTLIAAVTTIVAASVASSACIWVFYQPEEPKSLMEE